MKLTTYALIALVVYLSITVTTDYYELKAQKIENQIKQKEQARIEKMSMTELIDLVGKVSKHET